MKGWIKKHDEMIRFSSFMLVYVVIPAVAIMTILSTVRGNAELWDIRVVNANGDIVYQEEAVKIKDKGNYVEIIDTNDGKTVRIKSDEKVIISERHHKVKASAISRIKR